MFKSRLRNSLITFPIYIGVEYALIFIGFYIYDATRAAINSFVGLVVLQIFRITNGAINACVAVVTYLIFKRRRVRHVVSCLYAVKFPLLEEMRFVDDATDVFGAVAESADVDTAARNFSTMTLGELNALRSLGKPIILIQTGLVLDAAVAQYRSERDAARAHSDH